MSSTPNYNELAERVRRGEITHEQAMAELGHAQAHSSAGSQAGPPKAPPIDHPTHLLAASALMHEQGLSELDALRVVTRSEVPAETIERERNRLQAHEDAIAEQKWLRTEPGRRHLAEQHRQEQARLAKDGQDARDYLASQGLEIDHLSDGDAINMSRLHEDESSQIVTYADHVAAIAAGDAAQEEDQA